MSSIAKSFPAGEMVLLFKRKQNGMDPESELEHQLKKYEFHNEFCKTGDQTIFKLTNFA